MDILKNKIKRKEQELKKLKESYRELFVLIKQDSLEYNSEYIVNIAERVLSFVTGEHYKKYQLHPKYSLDRGTNWNENGKRAGNNDIVYIHKNFHYDFRRYDSKLVGFICKIDDIFEAVSDKKNLWLWYCNNNNYRNSFNDFFNEFKSKKFEFLEIYEEFLSSNNSSHKKEEKFLFEIINEPSLKIKNMVVYLNNL